jgi:branched-chain amino acid transport system substrate-binding protein
MKKITKILTGIIVLVLVIWGGYALSNKGSAPEAKGTVKIGVILPLSGPFAEYGDAVKNGIVLAQKEAKKNNNVEFIFEDGQYDAKLSISAYIKLATVDKVNAVYVFGDGPNQAIAPIVKNFKDTALLAESSLGSLTAQDPNIFRVSERPEELARKAWEQLRKMNLKKVAIVKTQNQYLNMLFDNMKSQAQAGESVELVGDIQMWNETNFRTTLAKIKGSKEGYDAIGVYLFGGQIGQFYKQMGELKMTQQTFGTDFFESQSDIEVAGKLMDGAFYAHFDVSPEFKARVAAQFGTINQVAYTGNGYDVARMIIEGPELSNAQSIVEYFKKIDSYKGVLGTYSYATSEVDGDRYFKIPVYIKEIRNGKIETLN